MKLKLIFLCAVFLCCIVPTLAQVPAEFASGSMTTTNGPGTSTPPARLLQNAAGTTYTIPNTTVNVTATTSLQQYTGTSTGTGNPVVMFGANILSGSVAPASVAMMNPMSSIGSPVNTNYSNNAAGTAAGIDTTTNYAFDIFTSVNQWNQSSTPSTNGARIRMADLTLTFSSPVTNPYLQFVGLGGVTGSLGFATELDLFETVSTTGPITGTFTKLQGNTTMVVTANQINNGAATKNSSCSTNNAGCGTVRLNGTNITSVTFRVYIKGDGAAANWGTANNHGGDRWMMGVSLPETVSLSGTVFNDVNGASDSTVNGTGFNNPSGVQLYANLIDPSDNSVIGSVAVAANGTYSFDGMPANTNARIEISTVQGVATNAAPAVTLPTNWVNTGESPDSPALTDGKISVSVAAANITNLNFGIEQRPTASNNTAPSQANPGGTVSATVPATTFSVADTSGGTVSSIRIPTFPSNATSFTVGTTTYYPNAGSIPGVCPTATCAAFPGAGVTVPTNGSGNPTTALAVDPVDGTVAVGIPYVAIDNAGIESQPAATASIPFVDAAISGSIFNDINGLTDSTVNGTLPGTNAGGPLYANLFTSGGVFIKSVLVTSGGAYVFPGLNNGNYIVQISTAQGAAGTPLSATPTTLPAGWTYTGENVGSGAGSDGTPNGQLAVTIAGAVNTNNANFGIERLPSAGTASLPAQSNPSGTGNITIPATAFTGTDPDGSVANMRITAMPSNVTSITINGTTYTAGNFPGAGVIVPVNASGNPTQTITIDPVDGNNPSVIQYVMIDNAGKESASAGTVSVNYLGASASTGDISGTLTFNGSPLRYTLVTLLDAATNTQKVTRTDANGFYVFEDNAVSQSYVVKPLSGKYGFAPQSKYINLLDNAYETNFSAAETSYHPKNDFDGDGKSDAVVFRAAEGNWYIRQSADGEMKTVHFGMDGDVPVSADFDGDGKTDVAVYRPADGNWYIRQSGDESLKVVRFGSADDKLVPADYDRDGKADAAVFRSGVWYINRSSDNSVDIRHFGAAQDVPVAADYNGDGATDLAVFRSSDKTWYVLNSSDNSLSARVFGDATDVPAAGDFDGDGSADIVQFRSGSWFVNNSLTGFEAFSFGKAEDTSIIGDYDGDGRADTVIYRGGNWFIRYSGDGSTASFAFGTETDYPVK